MRDANSEELLKRLQGGDERAIADLAEAYGTKIYQLAYRYLRNKEDAEEVTQDVLYKVYRNVGAFRGDSALSSWIYRITFNAAMSRLRRFVDSDQSDGAVPPAVRNIAYACIVLWLAVITSGRLIAYAVEANGATL